MLDIIYQETRPAVTGATARSVADLEAAQSLADTYIGLERFARASGFDHFFVFMTFSLAYPRRKTVILHNYPTEWFARYHSQNYYRVDPTFEHCRNYTSPLVWSRLRAPRATAPDYRALLAESQEFGISDGVTYPLHGAANEWGLLTFNLPRRPDGSGGVADDIVGAGNVFAGHLQDALRRIVVERPTISTDAALTRREKECLLWIIEGKTSWETAQILAVAERTVVYHMQNAMQKLGAVNRIQAATRAVACLATDPDVLQGLGQRLAPAHQDLASITVMSSHGRTRAFAPAYAS